MSPCGHGMPRVEPRCRVGWFRSAAWSGLLGVALCGCGAGSEARREDGGAAHPTAAVTGPAAAAGAEERAVGAEALGIEPVWATLTARGQMLDLRYRVVDAEKAKFILRRTTTKIGLVNQMSGRGVGVFQGIGKLSRLKQSTYAPEVGRIYSMIFVNAGVFQPGDLATLKVEDFEVRDIPVQ